MKNRVGAFPGVFSMANSGCEKCGLDGLAQQYNKLIVLVYFLLLQY